MTFEQRRNGLTTHFSERIPVVKRRMAVIHDQTACSSNILPFIALRYEHGRRC